MIVKRRNKIGGIYRFPSNTSNEYIIDHVLKDFSLKCAKLIEEYYDPEVGLSSLCTYGDAVYDSAGEYNLGDYTVTNSSAGYVGYVIKDCKIIVLCNSEGIPSSSGVTISGNIEDINYRTNDGSAITLTPNSSFPVSLKIGFHSYN